VFLKANKCLEAAKGVFVLNGFVTDHVDIVREMSRTYRYLAAFEQASAMGHHRHTPGAGPSNG
jgi:hypothetical protein